MAENSAERKTRNDTIRVALAEFRLLGEIDDGREVGIPRDKGFMLSKDYVSNVLSSLEGLRDEFDSVQDNAMRMEKRTAGRGRLDDSSDDEDDDAPQMTMMTIRNSKPAFTKQGRIILASAERCSEILSSDRMSVKDAVVLARNLRFLSEFPVLEAAGRKDPDSSLTPEHHRSSLGMRCGVGEWADKVWAMVADEPYARLSAMLEEIFGSGAVRELEGTVPAEKERFISGNMSDPESLCSFVVSLSALKDQDKTGWDVRFPAAIREISAKIAAMDMKTDSLEEEKKILSAYAGVNKVPGSASEYLKAAKEAEKKAGKLRFASIRTKDGQEADLPVSGLGHIFNPKRYLSGDGKGNSPLDYVKDSFAVSYSLYSGRQALQNKILSAARILCGQDPEEKGELGGRSWFGPASESYLRAVPINLRGSAGEDLTGLCTTWFSVDSALSRLEAIPLELIPKEDPLVEEVKKERESCRKLLGMLSSAVDKAIGGNPDFRFRTDAVDARNFHLLETPAAPGLGESSLPYEITKDKMGEFVTNLLADKYQKTEEERENLKERIIRCCSADDTDRWKFFMTRLSETAGFRPSAYPVITGRSGKGVTVPPADADDRRCRENACRWIVDEIAGITDRRSPVLVSMLEAFSVFPEWNEMYGKAIEEQKHAREDFEKARAVQWLDVLRSSRDALSGPLKDLGDLTYTQASTVAARETNVLVAGLLSDAVMRRASRMLKDDALSSRTGRLTEEDTGRIYSHFMDISENRPAERDPVEDFACSMFLRPVIRQSLMQTRKNVERNLNKQIDEEDRTNGDSVRRPSDLIFLKTGGVMDFGSDVVLSDETFSAVAEAALLHRSALEMSGLDEKDAAARESILHYAEEKLDNVVLENLCGAVTDEEISVAEATMDASVQKELVDRARDAWLASREEMFAGRMPESATLLSDAEEAIREAYGNNPLMDPERRLIPMMESYDDRIPDILREERWASPDARFSERMNGSGFEPDDDKVPESVLLEASKAWMAEQKDTCIKIYGKASSLSALGIEDIERATAMARTIVSASVDVFSPVAGVLMERGLSDGASAMSFIHTVETAKQNLRKGTLREMKQEFLKGVAEMGQRLGGGRGDGEKQIQEWVPEIRDAGIGYVALVTKTDEPGLYCAGEPSAQTMEENRLYEAVPKKGVTEKDGGWRSLTEKLRAMAPQEQGDYAAWNEKSLFVAEKPKKGSRLEKWESVQEAGMRAFAERAGRTAEMLMG